jgi:hypothetical protein
VQRCGKSRIRFGRGEKRGRGCAQIQCGSRVRMRGRSRPSAGRGGKGRTHRHEAAQSQDCRLQTTAIAPRVHGDSRSRNEASAHSAAASTRCRTSRPSLCHITTTRVVRVRGRVATPSQPAIQQAILR